MFDGGLQECSVTVDANEETVCEVIKGVDKGRFVKFPKGVTLAKAVKEHNINNALIESEEE